MLLYSNSAYWRIVFELKGSIVFSCKNVLAGLIVALVTFVISYLRKREDVAFMSRVTPSNNVGWNMMGGTIVFAVVFRTNLGWQRYWEALTQLQLMYSKWGDAFTQAVGFVNVTILQLQQDSKGEDGENIQEDDDDDENITFLRDKLGSLQRNFSLLSALSAHRLTHGDVHRMERRCKIARWKDQVVLRKHLRIGEDLTGATQLPEFVKVQDRSQLNENLDNAWFGAYCLTDVPSQEEEEILADTSDRVHAVMYWIFHDLAEISRKLNIPPPIQSRMYQELSNGMLGLQNAIKIADVPFPFQFTQLFNVLVIAFTLFIPVYASVFTESMILSPLIAYVVHQSILIINQVAMQLETPFGTGYNDISVKDFHARFLETIIEINPVCKYKCGESKRLLEAQAAMAARKSLAARITVSRPSVVESLGMKARPTVGATFEGTNNRSTLQMPRVANGGRRPSFTSLFGAFGSSSTRDLSSSDPAVSALEASVAALRAELENPQKGTADADTAKDSSRQETNRDQSKATPVDSSKATPVDSGQIRATITDTGQTKATPSDTGKKEKKRVSRVSFMNQQPDFKTIAIPTVQESLHGESESPPDDASENGSRDSPPQPPLPGHQELDDEEADSLC